MKPYDFDNYIDYLNFACEAQSTKRGFKAELARAAGCQASYMSQALKGKVHLTEDQLIGAADYLHLLEAEVNFLLLSLRRQKAASGRLRRHLEEAMATSRRERSDLKRRMPTGKYFENQDVLAVYFSSWIYSAVHLLTSSKATQTLEQIAHRIAVPTEKVKAVLNFLNEHRFVIHERGSWIFHGPSIHVPKDSPLQALVQSSRKELAMRSISLNSGDSLHFSSVFTISVADFNKLNELIGELVTTSHRMIQESGTEELACFCCDLFRVV